MSQIDNFLPSVKEKKGYQISSDKQQLYWNPMNVTKYSLA